MAASTLGGGPDRPAGDEPAAPARAPTSPTFSPLPPAEARLRLLFENSPAGIALHEVVLDGRGRPVDYVFLEVNAAFEHLTGLSRGAILGRRVTEALPGIERDPADWIGTYGRVALTGEPIRFEQHSGPLGRWFDVKAYSPARGYFGVVFTDVTAQAEARATVERLASERQQALDALREEARLRERFMDILGHDLRLPMTVVRAGVEALLRHEDADPRPILERCARATRSMESLVETLLDAARLRSGRRIPITPAAVDLGDLCRRVVEDAAAFAPGRRILLEIEGAPAVTWDGDRVAQALGNLLVNALAHGARDAPVGLSARAHGEEVELVVRNAGPPIAAAALPTLFEPFSSTPGGADRRAGLGLGLFIVREIASAHGGSVTVKSDAVETAFTLRLPRAPPP